MLLPDNEVDARLASPLNLMNRLRRETSREAVSQLVTVPSAAFELGNDKPLFMPPSADELVPDLDKKLELGTANRDAVGILTDSLSLLRMRLPEIQNAKELARIATDMGKVVGTIDEIRNGGRDKGPGAVIIYRPTINNETHYETVTANE